MKNLVLYYSWSKMANTEKLAKYLAEKLNADLEKLVDKNEKKGVIGWIMGGKKATKKETADIEPLKADLSQYDLIAIGGPVWSWNMNPVIRAVLANNSFAGKKVVIFCTMDGSGDERNFASMKEMLGQAEVVAEISALSKEIADNSYQARVDETVSKLGFGA